MRITIGESYGSFRESSRESGAYYVDKTLMLKQYLSNNFKKTVLFARPRRFGKTLTMTMFRDFLDVRQDSRDIFAGLEVMGYPDLVDDYMNRLPVVFLSLKEVYGDTFEAVSKRLAMQVSDLYEGYRHLLDSESISEGRKALFLKFCNEQADQEHVEKSLDYLCQMLNAHYHRPAFVIIDEYDVPMAKALGTSLYGRVNDTIERLLSYVCKTNDNVFAVMLSGCLYTVKNSTYTGVNNIIPYTVLTPSYASAIGFTDREVETLLTDAGLEAHKGIVREWYDGYRFGRDRVYCPWDVLRYVASVLDGSYDEDLGPEGYWVNTSSTSLGLVRGFLGKVPDVSEGFERLLAGDTIDCTVSDSLPYHTIHESGENLWSALVETGYLTKAVKGRPPLMPLRIPNKSIQCAFRAEVWSYFRDKVDSAFVRDLVGALWAREVERATSALSQILEATLSFYHEYREYSYHLILAGFFTGMGYLVQSERESGYGRSDLVVLDPARNRCLLLELKHVREQPEMTGALREAASQIVDKRYVSQLVFEGYATCIRYAMAFCQKRALIAEVTDSSAAMA